MFSGITLNSASPNGLLESDAAGGGTHLCSASPLEDETLLLGDDVCLLRPSPPAFSVRSAEDSQATESQALSFQGLSQSQWSPDTNTQSSQALVSQDGYFRFGRRLGSQLTDSAEDHVHPSAAAWTQAKRRRGEALRPDQNREGRLPATPAQSAAVRASISSSSCPCSRSECEKKRVSPSALAPSSLGRSDAQGCCAAEDAASCSSSTGKEKEGTSSPPRDVCSLGGREPRPDLKKGERIRDAATGAILQHFRGLGFSQMTSSDEEEGVEADDAVDAGGADKRCAEVAACAPSPEPQTGEDDRTDERESGEGQEVAGGDHEIHNTLLTGDHASPRRANEPRREGPSSDSATPSLHSSHPPLSSNSLPPLLSSAASSAARPGRSSSPEDGDEDEDDDDDAKTEKAEDDEDGGDTAMAAEAATNAAPTPASPSRTRPSSLAASSLPVTSPLSASTGARSLPSSLSVASAMPVAALASAGPRTSSAASSPACFSSAVAASSLSCAAAPSLSSLRGQQPAQPPRRPSVSSDDLDDLLNADLDAHGGETPPRPGFVRLSASAPVSFSAVEPPTVGCPASRVQRLFFSSLPSLAVAHAADPPPSAPSPRAVSASGLQAFSSASASASLSSAPSPRSHAAALASSWCIPSASRPCLSFPESQTRRRSGDPRRPAGAALEDWVLSAAALRMAAVCGQASAAAFLSSAASTPIKRQTFTQSPSTDALPVSSLSASPSSCSVWAAASSAPWISPARSAASSRETASAAAPPCSSFTSAGGQSGQSAAAVSSSLSSASGALGHSPPATVSRSRIREEGADAWGAFSRRPFAGEAAPQPQRAGSALQSAPAPSDRAAACASPQPSATGGAGAREAERGGEEPRRQLGEEVKEKARENSLAHSVQGLRPLAQGSVDTRQDEEDEALLLLMDDGSFAF
ncbi:hypothetical protein BESB_074440 [Besnoitia besnoiti]|uniref:Uncharacterized protein n=1 Tax=Besnoitia besnoiti TaxID=94643 RepID=A0A2A9MFY6_BESBE|nr:uncharacterized protein BESB_074440 [Besnoitia besnoiti]PFH34292.1 hypothetical protein BESB_074440 [Besnoitia besnoiti]